MGPFSRDNDGLHIQLGSQKPLSWPVKAIFLTIPPLLETIMTDDINIPRGT